MTNFEEFADVIEEMTQLSPEEVDFRAAVPSGTVLGKTEIEKGATAIWKKNHSGQRMGNKELPDRVALWQVVEGIDGVKRADLSMVPPTIALKRLSERPKEFSARKPKDVVDRVPIPESCDVCNRRRSTPRAFYDLDALDAHYEVLHPREWRARQRRREEAAQSENNDRLARLLEIALGQKGKT